MIETAHLFAPLHQQLLTLLDSLTPTDWSRPTACPGWTVHDIAAHILDTQLRLLSIGRDGHRLAPPTTDLNTFLNGLNATWVTAAQRLSPRVLTDLLRLTGPQLATYVTALDPYATALFPVAWAGHTRSDQWFDTARNYTEYWHHQQQIRDAVGAAPLYDRLWFHPVLALFVEAVPAAMPGQGIELTITGDAGGTWRFSSAAPLAATFTLSADHAWRLFTKALSPAQARPRITATGDPALLEQFLLVRAVMG